MASVLMLLSSGDRGTGGSVGSIKGSGQPPARVFECKTCKRQFPSFQALGGHRASHKKPPRADYGPGQGRPRAHECTVCGLEFAVGQALGGHMRKHRGGWAGLLGHSDQKEKKRVWLDLNLLPPEPEEEEEKEMKVFMKSSSVEFDNKICMVDCFH